MLTVFFSFAFNLGNHRQWLGANIVQVKDNERLLIGAVQPHFFLKLFVGFNELDFHIQLSRRLLDFGQEEQVAVDKCENAARRSLEVHRQRFHIRGHKLLAHSLACASAAGPAGVAVVVTLQRTVTVIHGCGIDSACQRVLSTRAWATTRLAAMPVLARRSLAILTILTRLLRGGCAVRDGSTAAAPPSTSLPPELPEGGFDP